MTDRMYPLSLRRKYQLLQLARSTTYYQAKLVSDTTLALRRLINELHWQYLFAGARMLLDLLRHQGHAIGKRRVATLMRRMDIPAIYWKPRASQRHPPHRIYTYFWRQLTITRPHHVRASDITSIPMRRGFVYVCAILNWSSRRVLAWRLSNMLTTNFCMEAVQEAISRHGPPEIFNTDRGYQFTSHKFTGRLKAHGIEFSMDGTGRWRDNVFVERLWRSLNTRRSTSRPTGLFKPPSRGLARYQTFYNQLRHASCA